MDIADSIIPGSLLVELGCGTALKTASLLNAIKEVHGRLYKFHFKNYNSSTILKFFVLTNSLRSQMLDDWFFVGVQYRCRYVGIHVSEVALNEIRRNLTDLVPGLKPNAIELIQEDFFKGLQQENAAILLKHSALHGLAVVLAIYQKKMQE